MGSLDVRDAFLQVEQDDPVLVFLQESFSSQNAICLVNALGQSCGICV